jgi:hypothetical protein
VWCHLPLKLLGTEKPINLEALFSGGNPFVASQEAAVHINDAGPKGEVEGADAIPF